MREVRRIPHAWSQGFTLMEMLVALSLLGLIGVLISGTFTFGTRAWEATSRQIDDISNVEAVQGLLRRELAQALPLSFGRAGEERKPAFAGSSDSLRFVGPLSLPYLGGGIYSFVLGLDEPTESLILQQQVYRPEQPPVAETPSEPSVLLTGVDDLQLAYFGTVEEGVDPTWHSQWAGKKLPELIRISVAFRDADRRTWPRFIVALKTSGEARQR